MRPWATEPAGRFDRLTIDSQILAGNPLGDPTERPLWVYTPPGYDGTDRRYPAVYVLQGLTGQVDMWWNRPPMRPTAMERLDAELSRSTVTPALVVLVDAWTSLGGSQFLNSAGTGRYLDYLCDEVVEFVEQRYRAIPDRDHRAVAGKSSGGYGAMVVPMLRPDRFGALATHAGDAAFEYCYLPDVARAARVLRDEYQGSYEQFWADFRARPAFSKEHDDQLLNVYCMAACYSADPDGSIQLPFDPASGRLRDDVWQRWLELDPVRMAAGRADALRSLRAVWIDAGTRDEYYLDVGAVAFGAELTRLGVEHRLELFPAGHGSIEYRYPPALAWLASRLAEDG